MWSKIQKVLCQWYHPHELPLTDRVKGDTWIANTVRDFAFAIDSTTKNMIDIASIILDGLYCLKMIGRCHPSSAIAVPGDRVVFVKDCDGVWTGETGVMGGIEKIEIGGRPVSLVVIHMDAGNYVSVTRDYIRIIQKITDHDVTRFHRWYHYLGWLVCAVWGHNTFCGWYNDWQISFQHCRMCERYNNDYRLPSLNLWTRFIMLEIAIIQFACKVRDAIRKGLRQNG